MKKKLEFENSRFLALFNCSNNADRWKDKSNYHFPSIVKNNGKEGLKLSKVGRKKWLAQIFRKDLSGRNLERTRMKLCFLPPLHWFFQTKFTISDLKSKYVFYPNGNRNWTASVGVLNQLQDLVTRISKFHDPTDSEHKFNKTRIENWLSIGFELGFPRLRTYCHNHYTMFNI